MTPISSGLAVLAVMALLASPALAQDASTSSPSPSRPGPTIPGSQPFDPSENVKALSEAANKRQDDLRAASEKLIQAQLASAEKENALRFDWQSQLRDASDKRLAEQSQLRAEYDGLLRAAESKRIDAIRAVDVQATANTTQRTTEQATALAVVVTQTAEVLRNQVSRQAEDTRALVATTAATALQNQQQQFSALSTRIAALEQTGAEGRGKQTFQDPALISLLQEVRSLSASRTATTAVGDGRSDVVGWVVAGIVVLVSLGGLVLNLMRGSGGNSNGDSNGNGSGNRNRERRHS